MGSNRNLIVFFKIVAFLNKSFNKKINLKDKLMEHQIYGILKSDGVLKVMING